ncbi:polysaccharide deacetylase family protein [Cohnella lupini]|uniref:Polysaccharide deacetylase n=1 Tax=Cohnella lupini TaxID=1294267 RepID=A0A3D9IT42_9BACL|nr:polysaccharide deacetylase family protein [Cohnella lupini]RED64951.1 polysaccharide deacetylase [Cohnella lupini]
MRITLDRFPDGKRMALTMSYDDGLYHDRRLVEIMNRYGIRGTFHLNSGKLGTQDYLEKGEIASLYEGHEISAHSVTHPFLPFIPKEQAVQELLNDRLALEELTGYPVRGMSYPFGSWDASVVSMLDSVGIEYARTVDSHGTFRMPENFQLWSPTCHHHDMIGHAERWLHDNRVFPTMALLYVWGHSFEFERENNWELLEQFGELAGNREDVWYATNMEIVQYSKALKALRFSASGELVHNPSALNVWINADGRVREIPGGSTVDLREAGK